MTPQHWGIVALCIAIVSLLLAVIGGTIGAPVYLILLALFIVMFTGARLPW